MSKAESPIVVGFDPETQGREVRDKLAEGMAVQQALAAVGIPNREHYRLMSNPAYKAFIEEGLAKGYEFCDGQAREEAQQGKKTAAEYWMKKMERQYRDIYGRYSLDEQSRYVRSNIDQLSDSERRAWTDALRGTFSPTIVVKDMR
jgi:hypothetical protein